MSNTNKESYIEMDFNYGILSKVLMKDQRVDIKAKAIYALLCTYAGSSRTAFPGVSLILADLGISRDTYYKHMNQLKKLGYVKVRQENSTGGQFMSNIYTISPCPNSSDTEKPESEKPYTENSYTKSNSLKINNIKNKQSEEVPLAAKQLATRLFKWIEKNYPNRQHDEKDTKKWAADIDKMNRLDGHSWDDIRDMIDWTQKHDFWHRNIKSGSKLRAKYKDLQDQKFDESKPKQNGFNKPVPYVLHNSLTQKKEEPAPEIKRADVNSEAYKQYLKKKQELKEKWNK
jgi:hypothetical protein